VRRFFFAGVLVHRAEQAQKEHHALLEAMRAKDWDRLAQTIREHNRGALDDYAIFLDSRLAPAATKGER
jgi:DNA-binding GntR family transcriptional regulator